MSSFTQTGNNYSFKIKQISIMHRLQIKWIYVQDFFEKSLIYLTPFQDKSKFLSFLKTEVAHVTYLLYDTFFFSSIIITPLLSAGLRSES